MKKPLLLLAVILFVSNVACAQIGFGTTNPDPSAAVDIQDTARGLLIPRMDAAHKHAIQNPANGLVIYQTDTPKGFWFYDGATWQMVNNSGKKTIVLADSITNSQAQAKIAAEFGPATEDIMIAGCLNLTSIDLSMFTRAVKIRVMDNPVLTSINFNNLITCEGGISVSDCPLLTNLSIPKLELIAATAPDNSLYMYNAGFTSLSFPKLRRIMGYIHLSYNPALVSLSFPVLLNMDVLNAYYNNSLTSVSCPLLEKVSTFDFVSDPSLATLSFPSLKEFKSKADGASSKVSNCSNISSVTLGNLISFNNYEFSILGGRLSSAVINGLLHSFVTVPGLTNKRINLGGQTPPAPPTGQGITDKATLTAQNNYMYTDE